MQATRVSPGLEEAQWTQLGAFRSGKADSPVVEMVTVPAVTLIDLEERVGGLEGEVSEYKRLNDNQLALITQLRRELAEAQARIR
jgi:hypothetical protein